MGKMDNTMDIGEFFKGTKGKWVLKEQGDVNEYCILTDQMKWVSAFKLNGEQGREEQMANMNLFAAALDLLNACMVAKKEIELGTADQLTLDILYDAINKALR